MDHSESGETRRARWAGLSATCRGRESNEDAFGVFDEAEIFVVADGCGSRRPAEITLSCFGDSGGAAAGLTERGVPYRSSSPPLSQLLGPPADALAWAVVAANRLVYADVVNRAPSGVGCTMAALRLQPQWAALTHVGDCRVGMLRDETFRWLTEDHSLLVEARRQGTPAKELEHIRQVHSTVITRAVGVQEPIDVDLRYCSIRQDDLLLLCTDGLWRALSQEAIVEVIRKPNRSLLDQCRSLLAAVEAEGGHDNATVLLAEVTSAS